MRAPWHGRLRLGFCPRDGRTVLARRDHAGPVLVQRPFYPGDGACHVYMLHPPGGLARDDRLEVHIDVHGGGNALLTTPAATKVYRSPQPGSARGPPLAWRSPQPGSARGPPLAWRSPQPGSARGLPLAWKSPQPGSARGLPLAWKSPAESSVSQHLDVGAGCGLEWLPQETILFGGSGYRARTRVRLAPDARFSAWEIVTLGRPASGDGYDAGTAHLETRIDVGEEPRLVERLGWDRSAGGSAPVLAAPWGLGGNPTLATYYAYPADADTLDRARHLIGDCEAIGATLLDDLLVVRMLAREVEHVRTLLADVWQGLRETVAGLPASPPRVWAT